MLFDTAEVANQGIEPQPAEAARVYSALNVHRSHLPSGLHPGAGRVFSGMQSVSAASPPGIEPGTHNLEGCCSIH